MGFLKSLGRAATGVATGGISEFFRKDAFGVPNAAQYGLPVAAGILGAKFGGAGLGASLAGSIFSAQQGSRATEEANAMNLAIAREQMGFSGAQADKQMAFQERMSNTSFQRSVEDLKKAGLNPLLALPSGASSPSGASGSSAGADMDPVPQVAERAMATAMEAKRFDKEMKLLDNHIRSSRLDYDLRYEDMRGRAIENQFLEKRNRFFDDNPFMYKLHAAQGGLSSASSVLRVFK